MYIRFSWVSDLHTLCRTYRNVCLYTLLVRGLDIFVLKGNTSGLEEGLVLDRMAICARVNGLYIYIPSTT